MNAKEQVTKNKRKGKGKWLKEKATHYVTEKNKHNSDTVKKLGEKAKEAAGVQAG